MPQITLSDIKTAASALGKLVRHPEETAHVFTILDALSGPSQGYVLARVQGENPRLLKEKPNILSLLNDRKALEAMPRDSLAHAYLAFLEREQITPDGLVEAAETGEIGKIQQQSIDSQYLFGRLRDTHDLWHVVTGYQGDVHGEAALLGFIAAQAHHLGAALMATTAILRAARLDVLQNVLRGVRAGQKAAWLPAQDWESLLAQPLEVVRRHLKVQPAPPYIRLSARWKPLPN